MSFLTGRSTGWETVSGTTRLRSSSYAEASRYARKREDRYARKREDRYARKREDRFAMTMDERKVDDG
jgi:hypothetical protein